MRLYDNSEITLSEDTTTQPKQIRLSEKFTDTDITLLKDLKVRQETFAVGSHSIELGNIAEGRFILVKPANNCQLQINGSNALTIRGGKVTKLWAIFTQIDLIVSSQPNQILIVVAGE